MAQQSFPARISIPADDGTSGILRVRALLDDIYSSLSHDRWRAVLWPLIHESTPTDLQMLSVAGMTREQTANTGSRLAELKRQTHVSPCHTALPKLSALGPRDFNSGATSVESITGTAKQGGA